MSKSSRKHILASPVLALLIMQALFTIDTKSQTPSSGGRHPQSPSDQVTSEQSDVPLLPLTEIPADIERKLEEAYVKTIRIAGRPPSHPEIFAAAEGRYLEECKAGAVTGRSLKDVGVECHLVSGHARSLLTGEFSTWVKQHGYTDTLQTFEVLAAMRSCALGDPDGCNDYGQLMMAKGDTEAARRAWGTPSCLGDLTCHRRYETLAQRVFDPPLRPVPIIPEELLNHMNKNSRAIWMPQCVQDPTIGRDDRNIKDMATGCGMIASELGTDGAVGWGSKHGYTAVESKLEAAFSARACSLGYGPGCFTYAASLREVHDPEESHIWSLQACQSYDYCRTRGHGGAPIVNNLDKPNALASTLSAVNEGLSAVGDTLEQHNQQQAAQNDARMQQAQAQVAANDARRAEQTYTKTYSGQTSNGAIRKETLVGNNSTGWTDTIQCFAPGANLPYDSFSRSGPTEFIQNIPACPTPPSQPAIATAPSPTAAPPVPYQKPPSTGGTVVSSGTACPASGWIMVQTGDVAVGHQCTPGQPIPASYSGGSGSGSGSGGSGASSGSGSGTSGFQSVPPVFNCIAQSYVHDDLTFTNNCNVPLYVTWWIGGHSGGWTIDPGTSNGTGYTGADVAAGGGDTFYVCPKGASPVDASGHVLTSAASNYTCKF